ncbi:hypothetical protein [Endozoicomonas sp.]|uniref:hypothetical protein n=1 Tax=Endozoicomonas sp. TaxID=1892382 RepID=UPI002884ED66|nr:hypothetical protein [Endozoicomonas sp.]
MKNKQLTGRYTRSFAVTCLLGLLSITLAGCQGYADKLTSLYQEERLEGTNWAVLPFISHTNTPDEVTVQLDRILLVQLPSAGVKKPTAYKKPETNSAPDYLADIYELERAQLWARSQRINHSISGEILEWQYDEMNRFSTMLSLKVVDISSGEMVWSINGLGEGSPGESAYDVSRKLIVDLLAAMPVHKPQQDKEDIN